MTVLQRGDRVFSRTAKAAGLLILVILAGVATFLFIEAVPALTAPGEEIPGGEGLVGYVWPLVFGTLLAATVALLVATPLAVAIALFITQYAPRRLANGLGYVVDLLAAIPSIVYGFWGIYWLAPRLVPFYRWLEENLGFIPLFAGPTSSTGRTMLTVGLVLGVMILPIVSAISREVFTQVPTLHREAALALGATRWEMIRTAVLPFGRPGVIGATMLGLGRALGETIAVALVLSPAYVISFDILEAGTGNTIAANIALQFGEANATGRSALIASGLVLFAITLVVNLIARSVIYRRREFTGGAL